MLCDYNLLKQSISIILRYIKSLNNLIYALQALKCPDCIYASYINNGIIFIIVTVSHTTCWAGLLWLPVREGSGHVHTWCKLGFSIVFTFCSIQEKGTCITAWDGLYGVWPLCVNSRKHHINISLWCMTIMWQYAKTPHKFNITILLYTKTPNKCNIATSFCS